MNIPDKAVLAGMKFVMSEVGTQATENYVRKFIEAVSPHMATNYEWACEWRAFLDGPFDRMISHHPATRKPLTEQEAREEVESMNIERIPARLVRREVSEWEEQRP